MTLAIQVQSLSKNFSPNVEALAQIDLEIHRGEFISIMGPSGCGKSTLLRLMSGLEKPTSGSVSIAPEMNTFGFVFQDPHLLPWRTLEDNILLPLEFQKLPPSESQLRLSKVLELIGLKDFKGAYPSQLSGGMKMRASLARALITQPKILLLDEPFAALDEGLRSRLDRELRTLWKELGLTVIFVTHSIAEAIYVSNRLIVLSSRPGRIIRDDMVDLPDNRTASMKWTQSFLDQTAQLASFLESKETQ